LGIAAKNQALSTLISLIGKKELEEEIEISKLNALIIPLSHSIKKIICDYEEKQISSKQRFNILNCLTRFHLEKLHTKFLSYLLNIKESHDCNTLFLESFVSMLQKDEKINIKLSKISSADLQFSQTTSEKTIGRSSISDIYGNIDIIIEMPKFNLVIENKIYAGEQNKQIERYVKYCKNQNKEYLVLYLTLTGTESNQAGEEEYYSISYKNEILNWLDECLEKTKKYPKVFFGILYYKELINNKIFNNPPNCILMELKNLLLKPENRIVLKYLKEINEATNLIRNELRVKFFELLHEKLNGLNFSFIPTSSIINQIRLDKIWNERNCGFKLIQDDMILSITEKEKIYFCIEHDYVDIYYGLVIISDGKKCQPPNQEYAFIKDIKRIESLMNEKMQYELEKIDNFWFAWKYQGIFDQKFNDDSLNYELAEQLDKFANLFSEEIEKYLKAWEAVIKIYKK
jgi:hypothetical protein